MPGHPWNPTGQQPLATCPGATGSHFAAAAFPPSYIWLTRTVCSLAIQQQSPPCCCPGGPAGLSPAAKSAAGGPAGPPAASVQAQRQRLAVAFAQGPDLRLPARAPLPQKLVLCCQGLQLLRKVAGIKRRQLSAHLGILPLQLPKPRPAAAGRAQGMGYGVDGQQRYASRNNRSPTSPAAAGYFAAHSCPGLPLASGSCDGAHRSTSSSWMRSAGRRPSATSTRTSSSTCQGKRGGRRVGRQRPRRPGPMHAGGGGMRRHPCSAAAAAAATASAPGGPRQQAHTPAMCWNSGPPSGHPAPAAPAPTRQPAAAAGSPAGCDRDRPGNSSMQEQHAAC